MTVRKIKKHCRICWQESIDKNKPYICDYLPITENGIISFVCEKGHINNIIISNPRFEILLEIALDNISDEYYREAIFNFSSAQERFFEFVIEIMYSKLDISIKEWVEISKILKKIKGGYNLLEELEGTFSCKYARIESYINIKTILSKLNIDKLELDRINFILDKQIKKKEKFKNLWNDVKNQSERQLGAFLFLYTSTFGEIFKLDSRMISERNNIVHKGKIPTKEFVIEYGDYIMGNIYNIIHVLVDNDFNEEMNEIHYEKSQKKRNEIELLKKNEKKYHICTFDISNLMSDIFLSSSKFKGIEAILKDRKENHSGNNPI